MSRLAQLVAGLGAVAVTVRVRSQLEALSFDMYLVILHLYTKIVSIFKALMELSSRNHFSFFSPSDLDLKPTGPKVKLDLYLVMLHLCPRKGLHMFSIS
jgi:hypothetical protein